MRQSNSLSHTRWECKYHVVFIRKYRRKQLFGHIRQELGEVFRRLAQQKESYIEEGHLMPDHVHMMISVPRKYAVSQVVGFIKGKSAIHIARVYGERKRNFAGEHFWARGYFVSTVGRDENVIRQYICNQEQEDRRMDQMKLMWPTLSGPKEPLAVPSSPLRAAHKTKAPGFAGGYLLSNSAVVSESSWWIPNEQRSIELSLCSEV